MSEGGAVYFVRNWFEIVLDFLQVGGKAANIILKTTISWLLFEQLPDNLIGYHWLQLY